MKTIFFLDNWLIEKQICLDRVWSKPRFIKEVFEDYHPHVLGYGGYVTASWDERVGKYVMYVDIYPPEADPGTFSIRLESDDPAEWDDPLYEVATKPAWKGFERVVVDEQGERFWPVYIHSLAGTPLADHGYLMSTFHPIREKNQSIVGFSQDGMRFDIGQTRVWQQTKADTWCGWIWNEAAGLFEIITRPVHVDRRISVVTTPDMQTFSPAVTILQPDAFDPPGTEFYSMPVEPYEDLFIGQLHIFRTDLFEPGRIKMAGCMETHLTYSYNGLNWYRTLREPFLPPRDFGELGGGQIYGMEMLRTGKEKSEDSKILFFAHSSWGEHASYPDMQKAGFDTRGAFGLLLYEMRLDGFCSLRTKGKDGLLQTKTIIPQSGDLRLNLRTSRHTAVRVQILNGETGEPLPGYTLDEAISINGDHLFAQPQWQERTDLSELVGKPIRIEVMMREAELFAIRIDCQAYIGTEPTESLA
ncbi:MAG: hypothetical protein AAF702_32225 [Chloroflexota bacterium]